MIYVKKLLNTELKYDTDEEKLYRYHKYKKSWTLIDPKVSYDKSKNKFKYNKIEIDKKNFSIHRLIYYVCNDDFDIFNSKVTIDHKNVNHYDNRFDNLRTATMQEQTRNRLKNNKGELVKGFRVRKKGIKIYEGHYSKNKKVFTKCFLTEAEAVKFHTDNTIPF